MIGGFSISRALISFLFLFAIFTTTHAYGAQPRVFAPYVDMEKPNNNLAQLQADSKTQWYTLAFINAGDGCSPAWARMKSLAEDETILGYIQEARKHGGEFIIAFGGYEGTELAQACADAKSLEAAYQKVISRYHVSSLDFDVEHFAIEDQVSIDRRSEALQHLAAANPKLRIQFTLPATPTGLTPQAVNVLKSAVAHQVPVSLVNVMAMDYGIPVAEGGMGANAVSAAKGALEQLKTLGMHATLGITPMIGMNDTAGETFTLADAQTVLDYALAEPRVALLSFWSVGRDNGSCSGAVSPTCSGVAQGTWGYTNIFRKFQ